MKKTIVMILVLLLTSGCVNISKANIDELVNTTINSKYELHNHINSGYKYYLPRTLKSAITNEYNEIIRSKKYDYYLYVDLVAYFNHKPIELTIDNSAYYSKIFTKDDKKGLINISKNDEDYLVKIVYNYGKIEVVCAKEDINDVVTNSLVILSSIKYQDDVISSILSSSEFTSAEEQVNVFDKDKGEDNTLEDYDDTYTGNEEDDYDPDVIKERR